MTGSMTGGWTMEGLLTVWNDISYMVQLLAACILFLIPLRKNKGLAGRTCAAFFLFVLAVWLVNSRTPFPETGAGLLSGGLFLLYWASYLLLCIPFLWYCMGGGWARALSCALFACAVQHIAYDLYLIYTILGGTSYFVSVLLYLLVYGAAYVLVVRRLSENGRYTGSRGSLFPALTILILVWVLSIMDDSFITGFESGDLHRVIYRIIDGLCCIYVLWVQISQKELLRLQRELAGVGAALRVQKEQYEMTGQTIESINRKCHDLKHQIRALREMDDGREREAWLDDLENDIMIYDTALQTGCRALDVVLMEKALFCKNHGISWTCMADGSRLGFMKVEDVYAIFGNALDNAIRAVLELEDESQRVISVRVLSQEQILMIQVQNYYQGSLQFEAGLPVTTKPDKENHGYGMKSIRYTAEQYNGVLTVSAEGQLFTLQILIPVPGE